MTDFTKLPLNALLDLVNEDNPLAALPMEALDFGTPVQVNDNPLTTTILISAKPDSGYLDSVTVTYAKVDLDNLPGTASRKFAKTGPYLSDIIPAINERYGVNLMPGEYNNSFLGGPGEEVTLSQRAGSVVFCNSAVLKLKDVKGDGAYIEWRFPTQAEAFSSDLSGNPVEVIVVGDIDENVVYGLLPQWFPSGVGDPEPNVSSEIANLFQITFMENNLPTGSGILAPGKLVLTMTMDDVPTNKKLVAVVQDVSSAGRNTLTSLGTFRKESEIPAVKYLKETGTETVPTGVSNFYLTGMGGIYRTEKQVIPNGFGDKFFLNVLSNGFGDAIVAITPSFAGKNAQYSRSTDHGETWSGAQESTLQTISAAGGNADAMVALGNAGFGLQTVNGITWNSFATPIARTWGGVIKTDDKYVAVSVPEGDVITSVDGVNWTQESNAGLPMGTTALHMVTDGSNIFMSAGDQIRLRQADDSWSTVVSGFPCSAMTYGNGGVLALRDGVGPGLKSFDTGASWSSLYMPESENLYNEIYYFNGIFVLLPKAVKNVYRSGDNGANWLLTPRYNDPQLQSKVTYDQTQLLIFSVNAKGAGMVEHSATDGNSWGMFGFDAVASENATVTVTGQPALLIPGRLTPGGDPDITYFDVLAKGTVDTEVTYDCPEGTDVYMVHQDPSKAGIDAEYKLGWKLKSDLDRMLIAATNSTYGFAVTGDLTLGKVLATQLDWDAGSGGVEEPTIFSFDPATGEGMLDIANMSFSGTGTISLLVDGVLADTLKFVVAPALPANEQIFEGVGNYASGVEPPTFLQITNDTDVVNIPQYSRNVIVSAIGGKYAPAHPPLHINNSNKAPRFAINGDVIIAISSEEYDASEYFRSTDAGLTWSPVSTILDETYWDITYCAGVFMTASKVGGFIGYSNDDGLTWNEVALPGIYKCPRLTTSNELGGSGSFLLLSNTDSTVAYISNDAITWETIALPASTGALSIGGGNGFFIGIDDTSVFSGEVDPGGVSVTWNTYVKPVTATNDYSNFVHYDSSRSFCYSPAGWLFQSAGNGPLELFISADDGATWTNLGTQLIYRRILPYGSGFIGLTSGKVQRSDDGDVWTEVGDLPTGSYGFNGIFGTNGNVVIRNNVNEVYHATDITGAWTPLIVPEVPGAAVTGTVNKGGQVLLTFDAPLYEEYADAVIFHDKVEDFVNTTDFNVSFVAPAGTHLLISYTPPPPG